MYSNKKNQLIILLVLFLSCFSINFAQQTTKSYKIVDVTVEGNKFADGETIIAISGLRKGEQITIPALSKLQLALRNLWKRQQFSNVEILVDRYTPEGIFLTIKVQEFPRLNKFTAEGNEKVSPEDINKAISKSRGDIISPYDLYLMKLALKKLYKDNSLLYAKIDMELTPTDTAAYFNLKIKIEEGLEFHVNSIEFEGNKSLNSKDLAGTFDDTKTKHWWQVWRSSKFDKTKYEDDKKMLIDYYKKNGFYDAEIVKDTLKYNDSNETVAILITVNEGPKLFIHNINFVGNTVYSNDALVKRLDFKKGDPYDLDKFEKNLRGNEEQTDVASLYLDNGYLQMQIEKEEKRVAEDSVDITVKLYENTRVTIRKILIAGNTKTKDKVIRRELFTMPGEFFDKSAVIRSVKALSLLNYFNQEALQKGFEVKPVEQSNNQLTSVDILYKVEERSTDMVNASIGFAGSYGLTGSCGFTLNNFALDEPLLGGAGQVLNFNIEFGQSNKYQAFTVGYTEPWFLDRPTTVGFNLYYTWIKYGLSYYNLRRRGAIANLGRRFHWPDDYWRCDWSLRFQENLVEGAYSSYTYYKTGLSDELTFGQVLSRTSLDNLFFPTSGSRFSLTNYFAMGALGIGSIDYINTLLKYEAAETMYSYKETPKITLDISTYWGYINGLKSANSMSPIELFYMGGNGLTTIGNVTPLRGYSDKSIGPTNGGRVQAKHCAELRFSINQGAMPMYVYAFAEAGNVWTSIRKTDPFNLKRAAGLGLMLTINPIGVVGFSYGYGFDNDDTTGTKSGWKFLFTVGQ